ncbi:MAG: UDP-N-acetylmuramate dehydrogenase [Spirochaetes bacterium]|nr:UDP-N-acetylmuramate dehydrogenase [Spirochaetota bacterium]
MKTIYDLKMELREFGEVCEQEPMCRHTSFRTGGPAELLIVPRNGGAIPEILRIAGTSGRPLTVIGGCSNLLVSDGGIEGIVVMIREDDSMPGTLELAGIDIRADAAVSKERFIRFALEKGLAGMEFMAGIPGCLGGGIIMNAGTSMGWFADILRSIDIVDEGGGCRTLAVTSEMSSYRRMMIPGGAVVTGGLFRLRRAEDPGEPRRIIQEVLEDRKRKHPLQFPSAGSVFKNPEGHSSWKLIDEAGLKGATVGGAQVSELHTNFIINAGSATSGDIYELIRHVQSRVREKFGILLETEVRTVGEFV